MASVWLKVEPDVLWFNGIMSSTLAIFFGHDSALSVMNTQGEYVCTLEFEKINGIKHYDPSPYHSADRVLFKYTLRKCKEILARDYGIKSFGLMITKGFHPNDPGRALTGMALKEFDITEHMAMDDVQHHDLHCWSAFKSSGMNTGIVFSYDAGGDDYRGCIMRVGGTEEHKKVEYNQNPVGYMFSTLPGMLEFKHTLNGYTPIRGGDHPSEQMMYRTERLDLAGKIMGLSAYGQQPKNWEEECQWFRENIVPFAKDSNIDVYAEDYNACFMDYYKPCATAEDEIAMAWRIQKFSEILIKDIMDDVIMPEVFDYGNNVILTGGCAMNVLINQMLRDTYPEVDFYVPPNPGDSGLTMGMLARQYPDMFVPDYIHRSRTKLLDGDELQEVLDKRGEKIRIENLSDMISEGKIIGFIDLGLEIGARSLCNRSIIASASFPGIKDKINKEVKHREWFRPFAPVVRKEDVPIYFEGKNENLEHMAYALKTREEWRDTLTAINHVDDTARVQALSRHDSPWIYDLLKLQKPNVLLNTSFNISGKPILNTLEDALWVLDNRGLDAIVTPVGRHLWKIV